MGEARELRVQVCYARPGLEILRDVVVPEGATVHEAIKRSGVLDAPSEIDVSVSPVGIHGKVRALDTLLRDRDRIEIYRPLIADPKDSRRRRADKKAAGGR